MSIMTKKPLELLGYQFVRLKVAGVLVSKARVLVAPNSGKCRINKQNENSCEQNECIINKQNEKCKD